MKSAPKSPFQIWLSVQEHTRPGLMFLAEWLAAFAIAWLFWWVMFAGGRGSMQPALAASALSGLYATCLIYGRMLRVTGCKKCASAMPFIRREIGRRHLRDHEQCIESEYGREEWGRHYVRVDCKVVSQDVVTYRCRTCDQVWEEKVELPGSGYQPVEHRDL
ncbi:MAG TPA: hypothetical protein VMJ64_06560 [Anaerolineales bacterium]|nr:hypothetical protein [Anaerolineales bacterium]